MKYQNGILNDFCVLDVYNIKKYGIYINEIKSISLQDMTQQAQDSTLQENDAGFISKDEALSIHILTKRKSNTNILYEWEMGRNHGSKPDYIIEGLFFVSVTRAFKKNLEENHLFNQKEATRLIHKKINSLIYAFNKIQNYMCDFEKKFNYSRKMKSKGYRPILHILCPSIHNMKLCFHSLCNMKKQLKHNKIIVLLTFTHDSTLFRYNI